MIELCEPGSNLFQFEHKLTLFYNWMSTFPARDKLSSKTSALLSPKLTPENQAYEIKKLQLWEGRKKTVFNFCFQMLYP